MSSEKKIRVGGLVLWAENARIEVVRELSVYVGPPNPAQ